MKILVVAPDFPYPPNHGGRVDIWERIKKLHFYGADIDLLYTSYDDVEPEHYAEVMRYVGKISAVKRTRDIFYLFGLRPYQLASRKGLRKFKLEKSYDYIILESEYVIDLALIDTGAAKLALRVHNDEVAYYQSLFKSSKSIFKKIYYLIESYLFKINKRKFFQSVDFSLYISQEEQQKNLDLNFGESFYYPPDLDVSKFKDNPVNGFNVLFVGNLFTVNNVDGLIWYISNIHNRLLRSFPKYKLIVAGNTKGSDVSHIVEKEGIVFYDSPESLDDIYAQASVFINPMLFGAGVKLKTINAVLEGLPVVTTTVGAEGTGLINNKHCAIVDSPDDFFQSISNFFANPSMARELTAQAQDFLKLNFDNTQRFNRIFKK